MWQLLLGALRAAVRSCVLAPYVLLGIVSAASMRLVVGDHWLGRDSGRWLATRWARGAARVIGLKVRLHGQPAAAPVALVANHVSWLDIVGIATVVPVRFVAKSEVRQWPLLGYLAATAGTIFLCRRKTGALTAYIAQMSRLLESGERVCFFPEGTTTSGGAPKPFHSALFQAVVDAGVAVQPVAVRYGRGRDRVAPFVGDARFVTHLVRTMARPHTRLDLSFGTPASPGHPHRRVLAEQLRDSIGLLLANA